MQIKIKKLDPSVPLPQYQTPGSVAFDLTTKEDITLAPHEVKLARTGIIIQIPAGYMLMIASRSSLPIKKGVTLANGVGIIDQDYCGPEDEILVQLLNLRGEPVTLLKGERIAQAMFVRIDRAEWQETKELDSKTSRGGVGSTGGYK